MILIQVVLTANKRALLNAGVLYSLAVIKCLAEGNRILIPVLGVELKLKLVVTSKT
jgi:hypothetical protein